MRRRVPLLLPVLLGSGIGLLAFGTFGLWSALRDAEEQTRLEAARITATTADAVADVLRDRDVLSSIEEIRRFAIRDGSVERHADVLAKFQLPETPERDMLQQVADGLAEARRIGVDDPRTACERLDSLLASRLLDARGREFLALQGAWFAHRAGDVTLRDTWYAELGTTDTSYREVVGGALLLGATAGYEPPAGILERVVDLDDELVDALVARMRELGADDLAARVADRSGRARTRREVHAGVELRLARLVGATESVAIPAGRALLLYFPIDARNGDGALVDPTELCERLRAGDALGSVPWSGDPVVDAMLPSDVAPIVAGLFGLRPEPPQQQGWNATTSLVVVIAALAVCFVVALVASFRVMRAETAAVRARSDFLQSVTHELKTPLASIRLLSERLESGRVDEDRARAYYGMLADEATRLSVLIDNVLDLGRIERGERAYDMRSHDVGSIVEEAVEVFAPLAQRDGIALEVDGDLGGVEAVVDRGAIVQALLNVLENARKYAKSGARVVLRAAVVDRRVALDVRDFGPGVPAAERDAIFERFRRGDRHHSGSVAGVGLGLHLARSIVEAHGGEMDCVDPEGPGALFRMRIPMEEAS